MTINSSTLNGKSPATGGGLANNGSDGFYVSVQISSTTFGSNSAAQVGGNIYNVSQADHDTVIVTLTNTILKRDTVGDNIFSDSATIISLGYNLGNDSCGGFLTGLAISLAPIQCSARCRVMADLP
jgi:hypothetical protein